MSRFQLGEMAGIGKLGRILTCFVGLLGAASAVAADAEQQFSIHGFGTLGAVRTTSDNVEFVRDISQPRGARTHWDARPDSLFGLQGEWLVRSGLEAVVQGVSRYRYDRTFHPEIAWAYVKFDPSPNLGFRAGRLGTEFFMMADSRLVGYSYLTVRPPGDFFWYLPFSSIDGADVLLTEPIGESILRAKLFYGLSTGKIPLADKQWDIGGSPMGGGYLDYQIGGWQLRLGYSAIRFNRDLPINDVLDAYLPATAAAQTAQFLTTDGTRSDYYSLGVVYDRGPLQVQVMLNHVEQGSNAFESSQAGYVLAGYRFGVLTPYAGYSWVRSDRRGNGPNAVANRIMADSRSHQNTSILGARWDLAHNIALKAQWDGIRGDASSIFPYRRDQAAWNGRMDVFSVSMDFVF